MLNVFSCNKIEHNAHPQGDQYETRMTIMGDILQGAARPRPVWESRSCTSRHPGMLEDSLDIGSGRCFVLENPPYEVHKKKNLLAGMLIAEWLTVNGD